MTVNDYLAVGLASAAAGIIAWGWIRDSRSASSRRRVGCQAPSSDSRPSDTMTTYHPSVPNGEDSGVSLNVIHRALATVTRFEVIDGAGRQLIRRPCSITLSFQDNGRTLKVFIRGKGGWAEPSTSEPL